jgi:hypothetical protein
MIVAGWINGMPRLHIIPPASAAEIHYKLADIDQFRLDAAI